MRPRIFASLNPGYACWQGSIGFDSVVARMSAATCGTGSADGHDSPGFRCAHPGYACYAGRALCNARRNLARPQAFLSQDGCLMPHRTREFYASTSGDTWSLYRADDGRPMILHQPNAPSGGQQSSFELSAFLAEDRRGPEHQALRELIGELVTPPLKAEFDDHD